MNVADFWASSTAQERIQEMKMLRATIDPYMAVYRSISEDIELTSIAEEVDSEILCELHNKLSGYEQLISELEINTYFSHEDDKRNVIMSIHAGAGGVDAMDWAAQLERMYTRWFDRVGFQYEVDDRIEGEAGIKKVVIEVTGPYAFGYLKGEIGVHKVCHISEYDANHKKHTSFASVDVVPIYPESTVDIRDVDLEISTCCAGGPGGQHVNKTQSVIRLVHKPTGIIVRCQSQRSQIQNRKMAIQLLIQKLKKLENDKKQQSILDKYGKKVDAGFGNHIRTYVLQPYTLVNDHRTGYKTGDVHNILDGGISKMVEACVRNNNE